MNPRNNVSGVLDIFAMSPSVNNNLLDLLILVQRQVQFSTVLVVKYNGIDFGVEGELMNYLDLPVIRLTNSKQFHLKHHFKDDILAIVYVSVCSYQDVLDALVYNLNRMAQTKIIFVCSGMEDMMLDFLKLCWNKKMINAIAVVQENYYNYHPFPEMEIHLRSVHDNSVVFPNKMLNLEGYPLRIALDGIEPRDYFYTTRKGEELVGGYTGRLVRTLAEKLNATLKPRINGRNEVFHHTDYDAMLVSDVIDIYAGLAYQIPSTRGQSDVAEVIGWCLMLPVEPNLPQYLYYPMILGSLPILLMFAMVFVFSFTINCFLWIERRSKLSLRRLFFKEDCLRALLGQSFAESQQFSMKIRVIYFLSCTLGLFFNTWYLATLNTLVTTPPSEPRLTSMDDIFHSPLKILMFRGEYDDIAKTTDEFEKYLDTFELTYDNSWYHATRTALNRTYAYPVPTNKWKNIAEQQSMYSAPIFRNTDICIARFSLMVFLLNENSIFMKDLNQMIVRTHQSGLYDHWVKSTFLELVEGGRIKLNSQSGGEGPKPLTLDDMKWIWGLFGVLVGVDCVVFVGEVTFYKVRRVVIDG